MNSISRKTLLVSALAVLVVVGGGCFSKENEQRTAAPPAFKSEFFEAVVNNVNQNQEDPQEYQEKSQESPEPTQQVLVDPDHRTPIVTSTGGIVDIGKGIKMHLPNGWLYWQGELFSFFDCGDPSADFAYFCWKEILVSDSASSTVAIMQYSKLVGDFIPICLEQSLSLCEGKPPESNIIHTKDYSYAFDAGEVGVTVVSFEHKGKQIVTFASDEEPEELYQYIRSYLR